MRITQIELNHIGVFESEEIVFEPCPTAGKAEIHIFTGTNGTGKSTVLKALAAAFDEVAVTTKNEKTCRNNTNRLLEYCRYKNQKSSCTLLIKDEEELFNIEYMGCPKGAKHFHLKHEDVPSIESYRSAITSKRRDDSFIFKYALFAYSGNRAITSNDFLPETVISNNNPLHQTLEFYKNINSNYNISNWIKDSLLKRSYAQTQGLKIKQKNYEDTINKLEKALSEIVDYQVMFKLDTHLRDPVIEYNDIEHTIEVLPDGLKSMLSWLADLCMRLEGLDWENDTPVFDRNIILFLDEIEVHLHMEWQRKILPVIQKLLPNAQIFLSTHSPFVVNSVDDAWVYQLELDGRNAKVVQKRLSQDGYSVEQIIREVFGVKARFGLAVEQDIEKFKALRTEVLRSNDDKKSEKALLVLAKKLAEQSAELENLVSFELRQIEKHRKAQ